MRRIYSLLVLFLFSSMMLSFDTPNDKEVEKKTASTVNWMTFEEAVALNKKKPKKIFVDVYTDWCGWCKKMDASTFQKEEIAKYLNDNFYAVKFNAEQKEDITFNGTTFKFVESGRRGYHQLAAALTNNKLSYPTVVFMDEDSRMIQPIAGFLKPEQFDPIVKYIGGDHYKETQWNEFQKQYQSPF